MKKLILIFLIVVISPLFANKVNLIKTKELILKEEAIALSFEKYLLENFEFPTMKDLVSKKYLGEDFDTSNDLGKTINFDKKNSDLLEFHIDRKASGDTSEFYKKDVFRKNTYVTKNDKNVKLILNSNLAKNILYMLKTDGIEKNCDKKSKNTYCINSNNTNTIFVIQKYDYKELVMEYDITRYTKGPIVVHNDNFELTDVKALRNGIIIYDQNQIQYIKTPLGIKEVK